VKVMIPPHLQTAPPLEKAKILIQQLQAQNPSRGAKPITGPPSAVPSISLVIPEKKLTAPPPRRSFQENAHFQDLHQKMEQHVTEIKQQEQRQPVLAGGLLGAPPSSTTSDRGRRRFQESPLFQAAATNQQAQQSESPIQQQRGDRQDTISSPEIKPSMLPPPPKTIAASIHTPDVKEKTKLDVFSMPPPSLPARKYGNVPPPV